MFSNYNRGVFGGGDLSSHGSFPRSSRRDDEDALANLSGLRSSSRNTTQYMSDRVDETNMISSPDEAPSDNFKVVIRVRPPVPRELHGFTPFVNIVLTSPDAPQSITLCDTVDADDGRGSVVYSRQSFAFDHVYDAAAQQDEVYARSAQPAVLSVMEGYNATLIAYGQTGTGKTYTMEGFTSERQRGIIPRSIEEIFAYISACRDHQTKFLVRASYMQIYNEVISDLLKPPNPSARPLTVRHTPQRGVYVEGLSEWVVRNPRDVYGLIERGTALRATSSTKMSELSSRSHALFTVVVEINEGDEANPVAYRFGKLNIVDLAGSEKVRQTGVTGQRLEETKNINKSLHELGNVIAALTARPTGRAKHIPFRNSLLTSALRDSLGGNCKTTLFACISPALEAHAESLSTLQFANRAKHIRNAAVINEDLGNATLLRKYERELRLLRQQLEERNAAGVEGPMDAALMFELEEERRRAESDREAALEALQQSSSAHQQELQIRRALEKRIEELETIVGEGGTRGGPRTSEEYMHRLEELDRERQAMDEDRAQVDRYKQLLLKQRDIMLSLTTRLNERDETILQLQEEVDAYDAHVQALEEQLALDAEVDAGDAVGGGPAPPSTSRASSASRCVGALSEAQALELVQKARVAVEAGEPPRYRSELKAGVELSAEEKMIELVMLCGTGTSSNVSEAELQPLRQSLASRAEEIARQRCAEWQAAAAEKMTLLRFQLRLSEDCFQLLANKKYEAAHQHESAQYVSMLQEQSARSVEERRRLGREVDRLRFEVGQLLEKVGYTPTERAEVSRLWQALQTLEEDVLGTASSSAVLTEEQEERRRTLEERIACIEEKWASALQRWQSAPVMASPEHHARTGASHESNGEATAQAQSQIRKLTKQLDTHEKDRRALQTIMEQRVKVKVDSICALLQPEHELLTPAETHTRLYREATALQHLVNASLKAMAA